MIYGFSALRVKNVSAIVIYLLSHQDFSAIILALNENYSSVQLSNEVLNTLLFLVKLKCQCAQMNKINKIPSTFFTVRNCEFSHNKLLLLSWKIGKKKKSRIKLDSWEIASGTDLACNGVSNSWIYNLVYLG